MLISLVLQCLLASANPVQEACKVLERTFGQVPANVELTIVPWTRRTPSSDTSQA